MRNRGLIAARYVLYKYTGDKPPAKCRDYRLLAEKFTKALRARGMDVTVDHIHGAIYITAHRR